MILLGLTGGIGMGKSTTARLFGEYGIPVWDADAAVHRLYDQGGAAVAPIRALFPEAIEDGAVSRPALKRIIAADPGALDRIEAIVHPLLADDRAAFIAGATSDIVLFDIPLLFETNADGWLDVTATVSVAADTQRQRVLERPNMTEAQLDAILARQLSDAERRERADHVINTTTPETARADVDRIVSILRNSD
ncbi:MAG: dephospho-CoA kinase [Rhodobacterales bacterium]|nr:MAG: dephospho-CoA kinase [Rhodobacterales bacterium]